MTKLSSNNTKNNKDNTMEMERVCLGLLTTTTASISPNSSSDHQNSRNSNTTSICKQINMTLNLHKVGDSVTTVADKLELSASSCLVPSYYYHEQQQLNGLDDDDDDYGDIPPAVSHFVSEDAYVLKCGSRFGADLISSSEENDDDDDQQQQVQRRSIFGIIENKYLKPNESSGPTKPVTVSYYNAHMGESQAIATPDECCCEWRGGDWTRKELKRPLAPSMLPPPQQQSPSRQKQDDTAVDVRVIDLTGVQSLETCGVSLGENKTLHHFFRSLLICRHCSPGRNPSHVSSPWGQYYRTCSEDCDDDEDDDGEACQNCIVALVMTYGQMNDDGDNDENKVLLDDEGIEELLRYRIGDGAPSWYLHSLARLRCQGGGMDTMRGYLERYTNGDTRGDLEQYQQGWRLSSSAVDGSGRETDYILAVYRHLPPRMILDKEGPVMDSSSALPLGCLWETFKVDNEEDEEDDNPNNNTTKPPPTILHRPISSPYLPLSLFSFLSDLITPSHLAALQREALTIPQWTAWPEKQHYDSNPDSWTVFPLCHTFPSTDVSKRVFIEQTTSFVPETTRILKETCGTALRTALFSRLGPRVTLMPHTGWADLANHVVRVHLPLIVPPGGNCGLWVDGCVEYQREGDIVIFDDSKVHRAFNYSDEERIVLILDLERPDGLVPLGGATGGHTEELDEFIKQLT